MKFICGLAQQENEYVINGVKYIVGSSFQTCAQLARSVFLYDSNALKIISIWY